MPTFLLFCGHRSVVQQCCVRLHSTSNKVAPANKKSTTWRRDGKRERGINRGIKGRKKAASDGKDRGRARRWMEPKIGQLIDLLEEKDCLWDVNKKDYHVRNKRERAFEEMRNNLDIDVAEIKTKITSLHAQLG